MYRLTPSTAQVPVKRKTSNCSLHPPGRKRPGGFFGSMRFPCGLRLPGSKFHMGRFGRRRMFRGKSSAPVGGFWQGVRSRFLADNACSNPSTLTQVPGSRGIRASFQQLLSLSAGQMPTPDSVNALEMRALVPEKPMHSCIRKAICPRSTQRLWKSLCGRRLLLPGNPLFPATICFFHLSHSFFVSVFHRFPFDPSPSDAIL